jgi:hypothetical protein
MEACLIFWIGSFLTFEILSCPGNFLSCYLNSVRCHCLRAWNFSCFVAWVSLVSLYGRCTVSPFDCVLSHCLFYILFYWMYYVRTHCLLYILLHCLHYALSPYLDCVLSYCHIMSCFTAVLCPFSLSSLYPASLPVLWLITVCLMTCFITCFMACHCLY